MRFKFKTHMLAFVFAMLCVSEACTQLFQSTNYGGYTQPTFVQPTHFVASYGHYYKEIPIDYSKPNGFAEAQDEANRIYENQRDASWQW